MNKANVFLLVVVSSLITYISIDKRPVETVAADDPWVIWEFQKITIDTTDDDRFTSILNLDRESLNLTGWSGWQLFQVDDYGSANTHFWFRRIQP